MQIKVIVKKSIGAVASLLSVSSLTKNQNMTKANYSLHIFSLHYFPYNKLSISW